MGPSSLTKLGDYVETWLQRRDKARICTCVLSKLDLQLNNRSKKLQVNCEWMCRKCVRALANDIENAFSAIKRFEIGVSPDSLNQSPPSHIHFYQVPAKRVLLETGLETTVEAFLISDYITVGQYDDFTKRSGYQTRAEKTPGEPTYFDNPIVSQFGKRLSQYLRAVYLCWGDVSAFCCFTRFRLPTETEWLAAAVPDFTRRISRDQFFEIIEKQAQKIAQKQTPSGLLFSDGYEFTSNCEQGRHVVRSGPIEALTVDWNQPEVVRRHRRLVSPDYREIHTGFRVVNESTA